MKMRGMPILILDRFHNFELNINIDPHVFKSGIDKT